MSLTGEGLTTLLSAVVSVDHAGNFEDLDSLRLIDMVELVEAEFGIRIAAEHVTPQTFANVNTLAELITKLKGGGL